MAMITLKEYAQRLGKPRNTVYRKYENGGLKTARKMGRDIWVDEDEPYIDARVRTGRYVNWRAGQRRRATKNDTERSKE